MVSRNVSDKLVLSKAVKILEKAKIDYLKEELKKFGITTPEELDAALSETLAKLTIGIMTEKPVEAVNSA